MSDQIEPIDIDVNNNLIKNMDADDLNILHQFLTNSSQSADESSNNR